MRYPSKQYDLEEVPTLALPIKTGKEKRRERRKKQRKHLKY